MIAKLYKLKRFEEILGSIGLLYFLFLAISTFFFVRFLVSVSIDAVKPVKSVATPPARFELELVEQIEKAKE